jgi:pimeloyl-ACP methyl ester carboxylesterase
VVLVGHSFGGGPTVEAARLVNDRLGGLVLVDAALNIGSEGDTAAPGSALLSGLLSLAPLREALVATFLSNPRFTKRLLQSFIADPAIATEARVAIYQRTFVVFH